MLRADDAEEKTGNRVTLSTLHASKGLEFDIVFLIGCVEGLLPHSRTTDPKVTEAAPTDVEEERRLFYVGVTRARDRLLLCQARRRNVRGRVKPQAPSRFLEGLPEEYIEERSPDVARGMDTEELSNAAGDLIAQLLGE
jgi:superfamily I DNA/RNA helicase